MKFSAGLLAAAGLAAAAPSMEKRGASPLDVKLQMVGNSEVKATITNNGKNGLKVLKTGTILDDLPVEKANVSSGDKSTEFKGIRLRMKTDDLDESSFQRIAAGESVEATFDLAHSHDLAAGGKFKVKADGHLEFADESGHTLRGSVPYSSNDVEAEVDGAIAKAVSSAFEKRTHVQSDCSGSHGSALRTALDNCQRLAQAAGRAASSGSASKLEEYFHDSSSSTRRQVANVFSKSADECGSTNGGASKYYCEDEFNGCQRGVLAYTQPYYSRMVNCDLYYSGLPALSDRCHAQDQATTTLHESTHLTEVAGTRDNGYGYDAIRRLSSRESLNNADSYAQYANAIYVGC